MTQKSFYITTTLPYVNSDPHVGFAAEIIRADVIARYKKLLEYEVFFNTGTDEHGQKIYAKALESGKSPQQYTDELSAEFKGLKDALGLSEDLHFVRTTDEHHKKAAQEFWKLCDKNGDIEKKIYKIKYCVGCELEKTESELENNKCIIHPHLELEIREEENYFFKFSKYQKKLLELYEKNPQLVIPDFRFNEIKAFVERGLDDFSISRLKSKMPWGVEVPGDSEHVMYVWFDALVSYISTLGWPIDFVQGKPEENLFDKFWVNGETVQYAGKDNLRQQSAMWQAMLMSAGLPNTHTIVINGFINSGGQKMSKSLGNVISPQQMIDRYGSEATRIMLAGLNQFEDTDVNIGIKNEGFDLTYEANLSNGLGNLVSRIMKLGESYLEDTGKITLTIPSEYTEALDKFKVKKALDFIFQHVKDLDKEISEREPFKVIKTDKEAGTIIILQMIGKLYVIAKMLLPFIPETSKKISEAIEQHKKPNNLFPRLND